MPTSLKPEDLEGPDPMVAALGAIGITPAFLSRRLKRELNAKETHRVKVKGAVDPDNLPKGRKLVTTSGSLAYDKTGEVFGDGDSVIEWSEINWKVRQTARMDAQKLLGAYPAERKTVELDMTQEALNNIINILPPKLKDMVLTKLSDHLEGESDGE